MRTSETLTKIAPALVKALNEIGGVGKAAANPFFKSKYATLENVIDASKPSLASNGIVLVQFPGSFNQGAMSLETVLLHESGEWISGSEAFGVATGKQDPQAVGSALTYARRYAQMAVLNMPAVDDDGEAAMPRNQPQKAPQAPAIAKPLSARADALEKALRDAKPEDLDKSWALGSSLMAQLETDDKDRFAKLEALYVDLRTGK